MWLEEARPLRWIRGRWSGGLTLGSLPGWKSRVNGVAEDLERELLFPSHLRGRVSNSLLFFPY